MNGRQDSPMVQFIKWKESIKRGNSEEYPIVATSYSVCEHWQSGTQTRNIPWLVEIMPRPFVEISEELAKEKGIKNGDEIRVSRAGRSSWTREWVWIISIAAINGSITRLCPPNIT